MEIITIAALKGGIGKTNFLFNLAGFLAKIENKKILCIDIDPQANLTNNFNIESEKAYSAHLFLNIEKIDKLIQKTDIKNIDIIPTNIQMTELEKLLINETAREHRLSDYFFDNFDYLERQYDYVLIDTNPSLSITNINALTCASSIIVISDNSVNSYFSIELFYKNWQDVSSKLKKPNLIKAIILNNFNTYKHSKDFLYNIKNSNFKDFVVEPPILKKTIFQKSEVENTSAIFNKEFKKQDNPYFKIVKNLKTKGVL